MREKDEMDEKAGKDGKGDCEKKKDENSEKVEKLRY